MPQNLSVSQAAHLVGITRGILQKQIKSGKLSTFEGKVAISELLHLYPETKIVDNTMIERVERIKAKAVRRRVAVERETLDTQILATAINNLKTELTSVKSEYSDLVQTITQKLDIIANTDDANLRYSLIALQEWVRQFSA
ncbi:MAG: hypothetical protein KAI17_02590 [Thiotrichaceae bacterium]|nr:hypothetical protein [Thiotrichaceae bacterium]